MKYLKILLDPIKIKGDEDDLDTLKVDLYEKIQGLIESDSLGFSIDEDDHDDENEF